LDLRRGSFRQRLGRSPETMAREQLQEPGWLLIRWDPRVSHHHP
jgi:hypothetical protein